MTDELKGKKTESDLMAAYAAECMSAVKYRLYAEKAAQEGYRAIARELTALADEEQAHAKVWFSVLTGSIKSTETNLLDALRSEDYESGELYAHLSNNAKTEGFDEIGLLFEHIAAIEKKHAVTIKAMYDDVRLRRVFEKQTPCDWVCGACGHETRGEYAPDACALCGAKTEYFSAKI